MKLAQLSNVLHLQGVPFVSLDAYGIGISARSIGTWPGPRTQTASQGIKLVPTKHGATHRSTPTPPGASRAHET